MRSIVGLIFIGLVALTGYWIMFSKSIGGIDFVALLAFAAAIFVYWLFMKVLKFDKIFVRLLLPLWIVDFLFFGKFRSKRAKKVFRFLMWLAMYWQVMMVYGSRIFSPESWWANLSVGYWMGWIPLPWIWERGSLSTFSVAAFWLSMNGIGTFLMATILAIKNYRAALVDALLRYAPFKAAKKIDVVRRDLEIYRLQTDASVGHSDLITRQEEIGGAIGCPVLAINKISAGVYDFQIGELEASRDDRGRYISKVKWESLDFVPRYERRWFGKKYNPASRYIVPTGKAGGQTIYTNLLQMPHKGMIGISNSGKTSSMIAFLASAVKIDPQTIIVIVDLKKKGVDYSILEYDPIELFSEERAKDMTLQQWGQKFKKLDNIFLITSEMALVGFVRSMRTEIDRRERILRQYPGVGTLYDLEVKNEHFKLSNEENPNRPAKIIVVIDDYLVLKEADNELIQKVLREIEDYVSFTRYIKIHVAFLSQKGTVKVLDNTRDQLDMEAFGTPASVSEYVLKQKVSVPAGIGVYGYVNAESGLVGIACAPYIGRRVAAQQFAKANKELFDHNRALGIMLKASAHAEGDFEVMEGIAAGQRKLCGIPVMET